MKKKRIGIGFAVILLIVILFLFNTKPSIKINELKINVELAKTSIQQQRGLMERESLEGGMLFIYKNEDYKSFWMKDTLIPLDIIFINSNKEITDITTMQPCKKDPCETYTSKEPAKYVLEVNAGFAEDNNIKLGDIVKL